MISSNYSFRRKLFLVIYNDFNMLSRFTSGIAEGLCKGAALTQGWADCADSYAESGCDDRSDGD